MQKLGRIPQVGDQIEFSNLIFEVKEIKGLKIDLLQVRKKTNTIPFSNTENTL